MTMSQVEDIQLAAECMGLELILQRSQARVSKLGERLCR